MKRQKLPPLPVAVRLSEGFTASQLIQFADAVRTAALLEAANACMNRISRNMIESRMNGYTREDAEAMACAKAIHDTIAPELLERQEIPDLFGDYEKVA